MKKILFSLTAGAVLLCCGAADTISGRCFFDRNGDGKAGSPEDEYPLSGILVSDGYSIAETGPDGIYTLKRHPDARFVHVINTSAWSAVPFHRPITGNPAKLDFALSATARTAVPGEVKVLQVADSETYYMAYIFALRDLIRRDPGIDLIVHAGDITDNQPGGLKAHRDRFTCRELGRPTHFVIGNHDIVKRNDPKTPDPYGEILGPYYYSFERGGFLFVAAPMYHCFSPPLPYRMSDFGDYLAELLRRFPDTPKILLAHDLPDLTGDRVESRNGPIDLDRAGFIGALYGHKHMNEVLKYPSGRKAFCVNCPNRGGAGGMFPPSCRVTVFRADGSSESRLFRLGPEFRLDCALPSGEQVVRSADGKLQIRAVAIHSGEAGIDVRATVGNRSVSLKRIPGTDAFCGEIDAPASGTLELTATGSGGTNWKKNIPYGGSSGILFATQLPAATAFGGITVCGDLLLVPVTDDENAENGGIYALDRATGAIRWFYRTGYSVRNRVAVDERNVYAVDSRGDIHAATLADGSRVWLNRADRTLLNISSAGALVADGKVFAGNGALFRAVDCASGKTLWNNTGWTERTASCDFPQQYGELVLTTSYLNGLCAHDRTTGELKWRNYVNWNFPFASAGIDGDTIYLKREKELFQIDGKTGRTLGRTQTAANLATASAPVAAGELIVFGSRTKGLLAFHKKDLSPAWNVAVGPALLASAYYAEPSEQTVESTPLLCGERLYFGANDGRLREVECSSGRVLRSWYAGSPIPGRPERVGDLLYFADADGRVWAIQLNADNP